MAATPKPLRKDIKKVAKRMREYGKNKEENLPKPQAKMLEKLSNVGMKIHQKAKKHSKEDMQKAHAHMKKHGG